jgi:polysaccharide export outer membrane protein
MTTTGYKKRLRNLLLPAVIIIGLFSSCISPKETNMLQQGQKAYYSVKPFEDYKLRANDEIYCNISTVLATNMSNAAASSDIIMEDMKTAFNGVVSVNAAGGNSTSQNSYIIANDGNISIPFFGDIKIEGLTIPEAEKVIQRVVIRSSPFDEANVRVRLRNNVFYVVSEQRNGVYSIAKDNMTIYQAISVSGNIVDNVDLDKVKIVRKGEDGKDVVMTFNLKSESVIESEFYYIRPNDVIYYTTSNSSFFRVNSFTGLFATILTPITFLISMLAFDI